MTLESSVQKSILTGQFWNFILKYRSKYFSHLFLSTIHFLNEYYHLVRKAVQLCTGSLMLQKNVPELIPEGFTLHSHHTEDTKYSIINYFFSWDSNFLLY
jgi:hypothetical protein